MHDHGKYLPAIHMVYLSYGGRQHMVDDLKYKGHKTWFKCLKLDYKNNLMFCNC